MFAERAESPRVRQRTMPFSDDCIFLCSQVLAAPSTADQTGLVAKMNQKRHSIAGAFAAPAALHTFVYFDYLPAIQCFASAAPGKTRYGRLRD